MYRTLQRSCIFLTHDLVCCCALPVQYSSTYLTLGLCISHVQVAEDRVTIKGGVTFGCVAAEDFMLALAEE